MSGRCLLPVIFSILYTTVVNADLGSAGDARARGDYPTAVAEYQRLAEAGDPVAQVNLGYMYYMGEGVNQDFGQAIAWYNEAASRGNADAQYNLAVAYAFGEGVSQDFATAVEWYQAAANQGHVVAQYSLGLSFANGEGVPRDPVQAVSWFTRSAEQGYIPAQLLLATKYYTGEGAPLDYALSARWFQAAADQGNAIAQYNLASLYRNGQGVTQDLDQARNWFGKAATQGYEDAATELAAMDQTAVSIAPSEMAEAISLVSVETESMASGPAVSEPTAPTGNVDTVADAVEETTAAAATAENAPTSPRPPAPDSTAELIQRQLAGINPALADTPAPPAAEPGAVVRSDLPTDRSQPYTGTVMEPALMSIESIVPALPDESPANMIEFLTSSAATSTVSTPVDPVAREDAVVDAPEMDLPATQPGAIETTDSSVNAPPDAGPNPAVMTPESAGAVPATDEIQLLYEEGLNELKNRNFGVAHRLFSSAAGGEHAPSRYQLGLLYQQGLGTGQDNETSAHWFRLAAEQGLVDAQFSLANLYLLGEGVVRDEVQARYWYEQAADQGHTGAIHNLQNLARLNPVPLEQVENLPMENPTTDNTLSEPQTELIALPVQEPVQQSSLAPEITTSLTPVAAQTRSAQPGTSSAVQDYERGLFYASGNELPRDMKSAFTYFKRAADANHAPAQYKLGVAYAYGEGTTIDPVQSAYWYEKAALQGHPIAQRNLGLLYLSADNRVQDRPLALAWLSILADRGAEMDVQRVQSLRSELPPDQLVRADQLKQQLLAKMSNPSGQPVPVNP